MRSSGPEKYACYNETLLYQGYKNNKIQRKFTIWDHKNYLVIMKPRYIGALYNDSPLYQVSCYKVETKYNTILGTETICSFTSDIL